MDGGGYHTDGPIKERGVDTGRWDLEYHTDGLYQRDRGRNQAGGTRWPRNAKKGEGAGSSKEGGYWTVY